MSMIGSRTPLASRPSAAGPSGSTNPAAAAPPGGRSVFRAPQWVQNVYSKFPLVVLEPEDEPDWRREYEGSGSLWIAPPTVEGTNPHFRPWASSSPACLRLQLLFLLRHVHVTFRPWTNESAAPGGKLPALHTLAVEGEKEVEQLLPADQIRGWLDSRYPLKGKNKELQGMPTQEAYDRGIALAQLVLGHLLPAYLASLPETSSSALSSISSSISTSTAKVNHLLFPTPPPLAAGLKTPLPAALTGDARTIDRAEVVEKGLDALDAVRLAVKEDWALGAKHPTPLDALLASHIYPIYSNESSLSTHLATMPEIGDYVDRVLTVAGARVK